MVDALPPKPRPPKALSKIGGKNAWRELHPEVAYSPALLKNYLEYRLDEGTDIKNATSRSRDMGISVQMVRLLEKSSGFYDMLRVARYRSNKRHLLEVDKAMFSKATKKQSVEAAKLMYERWDPEYVTRNISLNANVELQSLSSKSAAELDEMASTLANEIRQMRQTLDALKPNAPTTYAAHAQTVDAPTPSDPGPTPTGAWKPRSASKLDPPPCTDEVCAESINNVDEAVNTKSMPYPDDSSKPSPITQKEPSPT